MPHYKVQYSLLATDPSSKNFPVNIFNEIEFAGYIKTTNEGQVNILTEAENISEAIAKSKKTLLEYLDFYALAGQHSFDIKGFFKRPLRIWDLDKNKELTVPRVAVFRLEQNSTLIKKIFLKYWPELSKKENDYLRIALIFFRRIKLTYDIERNIIDSVILFEALYSKNSERSEITYKLSNRMTTLLAKDSKERITMLDELRELYKVRSAIVHGSEIPPQKSSWPLTIWARESILRFLKLSTIYGSHDKIIEKLDHAMLENSLRDKLRKQSEKALTKHPKVIGKFYP